MPVDGFDVPGWLWLLGALFLYVGAIEFLDDDDAAPWPDIGRLSTLLTFVLFLFAYAFYGVEQSRSWWESVKDLGRDQLESVVPVAALTQFILLLIFWFLLGRLLGMRWSWLLEPLFDSVRAVGFVLGLLTFTVALLGALNGQSGYVVLGLAGLVAASYLLGVSINWRPSIARVLIGLLLQVLVYGTLAGIAAVIMRWMDRGLPGLGATLRIELIVCAIALLAFCYFFRLSATEQPTTPPMLFHFIDLSLVVSAAVIALVGLPGSSVTLGPVPAVLVAVGPSVIVAVVIFVVHLAQARRTTRNWERAMAVSVGASAVAVPVMLLVTAALVPLLGLLPLPSW